MIAFALLAFLVSYAHGDLYNWEGPLDGKVNPTTQETQHVCLTDTASCGCCLMQKTLYRMEEYFNMSLSALQDSLRDTRSVLTNIRASRSAFSVALTDSRWCLGPFRSDVTIMYKHVFINMGENYDIRTGVFTAPRSGVYSFSLTVYSDSGSAKNALAACARMMVNDDVVSVHNDSNMQDQEDSSTSVVALMLSAGDRVCVKLPANCYLCDSGSHYNTFTGFLLYSTD